MGETVAHNARQSAGELTSGVSPRLWLAPLDVSTCHQLKFGFVRGHSFYTPTKEAMM
jgi:hypothetical protein